jgi:poly-gamma-glutamate synthesis protein (capsule biosynthesis protein)
MKRCSIVLAVSLLTIILSTYAPASVGVGSEPLPASRPGEAALTLLFTGDIMLDRGVRQHIGHFGADHLFTPAVDSLFAEADYVVGNLECPATSIVSPAFKRYVFRAEPQWLDVLRRHGFTHLNLANNHSIDQGRRGLMDTQRNIGQAGMTPFGAGRTMDEAAAPLQLADNIYLLASCRLPLENYAYLPGQPCVSQEPLEQLLARIADIRTAHHRAAIVVSLHWGAEHALKPLPQQRMEARRIIDAGADAIIGHHTHTLQPTERYRGKLICYGIGNFIFDQRKPQNCRAAVVKLTVCDDSVASELIPIDISLCVPTITKE